MQQRGNIRYYLHSDLDAQWRELFNIYLARDSRMLEVDEQDADFIVLRMVDLGGKKMSFFKGRRFIVLNFGDLPMSMLGLRPEDEKFRQASKDAGAEFFYLQGEVEPKDAHSESGCSNFCSYRLDKLHIGGNQTVLTLPLGYCSGSKINLFYEDNDESTYFVRTCKPNPKRYQYDWCWIGAASSKDRRELFGRLNHVNGTHKYVISAISKTHDREKRMKELHADNKTVPYAQYLNYHRRSKVCISANGMGMWNYKDGEFFANNCFVLRQRHKNLGLNPWTPKDGVHWAVFDTEDVEEAISYYVHNDVEREKINDAGFDYFKWGIHGGWAGKYADMFLDYLNGREKPFRKAEYRGAHA